MNKGNKAPLGTKEEMNVNRIYNRVLLGKSITEEEKQFFKSSWNTRTSRSNRWQGWLLSTIRTNLIKLKS